MHCLTGEEEVIKLPAGRRCPWQRLLQKMRPSKTSGCICSTCIVRVDIETDNTASKRKLRWQLFVYI